MPKLITEKFKLLILDCPVAIWDLPDAQAMFQSILALKLETPWATLDTGDFYGTHLTVCSMSPAGSLEPIATFNSVSLSRARHFHQGFPALRVAKHRALIQATLAEAGKRGRNCAFASSWALARRTERDPELRKSLWSLLALASRKHHEEQAIEAWYSSPSLIHPEAASSEIHSYLEWLGGNPLDGPLTKKGSHLYLHERLSEDAHLASSAFEHYWKQRIVLGPKKQVDREKTAA